MLCTALGLRARVRVMLGLGLGLFMLGVMCTPTTIDEDSEVLVGYPIYSHQVCLNLVVFH